MANWPKCKKCGSVLNVWHSQGSTWAYCSNEDCFFHTNAQQPVNR